MKVPGLFFELNEMPSKVGRGSPDFVWHFFIIDARKPNIFAKCSAAQYLPKQRAKEGLRSKQRFVRKRHFSNSPVKGNPRFFNFVLLSGPRAPFSESQADKNESFLPFFVCFPLRVLMLAYSQKSRFLKIALNPARTKGKFI